MLVSIIVTAYNAEKYIADCLESIIAQTVGDFQLIVIDDGSSDSTPEIVRDFCGNHNQCQLISQPNQGPSSARNIGLKHASGKFVLFVDGDDTLSTHALQILLEAQRATNADIVNSPVQRGIRCTVSPTGEYHTYTPEEAIRQTLYQTTELNNSACGKLISRDLALKHLFRNTWYEDLDWFYHIFAEATIITSVTDRVYYYRPNHESFLANFNPQRLDVLAVTERMEKLITHRYPRLTRAARNRRLSANFNMLMLLEQTTSRHEHHAIKSQCWDVIKSHRWECITDSNSRIKNRIGSAFSYLGRFLFRLMAK